MADDADRAQEKIEGAILNEIVRLTLAQQPTDVFDCVTCGEEIPPERKRRVPSAVRCVGCQAKHEMIGRPGFRGAFSND